MEDFSQHCPFTRFTHDLLAKTELNTAIYYLQHQSGFNINIVLYLLWLARSSYGRLTKKNIKLLQDQIALWHQRVIAELKYTHALVANNVDPVAIQIKNALQEEIAKAHIIEQQMLYESRLKKQVLRRSPFQELADACASIVHYCELKNDLLIGNDQAAFTQLFYYIFDAMEKTDIEKQVADAFLRFKTPSAQPVQMAWEEF